MENKFEENKDQQSGNDSSGPLQEETKKESEDMNLNNTNVNNKINTNVNNNTSNTNMNNTNINNQSDQANDNMRIQMLSQLKIIQEMSNNNDENSFQFFSERMPQIIQSFLATNMITYNLQMLKLVFLFFANYIQIRINYLDSMPNSELGMMVKILEPAFPFHININNNFNQSAEFYEEFFREAFPCNPSGKILSQSFKVTSNVNIFFCYILTFIQQTDFFGNFVQFLNAPMMEYEKFLFTYSNLSRIMYYYECFDGGILGEFINAVSGYYERLFESGLVKDIKKNNLELFFKGNTLSDFNTLYSISDSLADFRPYEEFLKKDLKMIYFLIMSQNLERRVIGMKSLNELIQFILQFEKLDENSLREKNVRFMHQMLLNKKRLVIEWLEKVNIFQIIFGENIHEAILKKSSLILIFLYINDKLSFEQIDFIWKVSQDKHEAISACILNIFSDLISSFSIEQAMHILRIINEIPFKEVNDVTIKILDSFSNNKYLIQTVGGGESSFLNKNEAGIKNNAEESNINFTSDLLGNNELNLPLMKNELEFLLAPQLNNDTKDVNDFKAFYLKILWKYSSDNSFYSGLSAQIISKARKVLASILLKPVFKYELAKYTKKCIYGINCNYLLTTNLTVLDSILKNMKQTNAAALSEVLKSSFGSEVKDLRSFFDYLEKQYSLTSTILHAIINVKKEVMVMAGEIISLQSNLLMSNEEEKEKVFSFNDIMSNYDIKFNDSAEKFCNVKCLKEEEKQKEAGQIGNMVNNLEYEINRDQNEEMNEEFKIEINNQNSNVNLHHININNNMNLDETLSTEKSLDNSISSISTDISSIEKSRIYLVKEFIENNLNYYSSNMASIHSVPLFQDNYEIIFKRLKLNFTNANYYSVVNSLLEFYKFIIFSSNIQITQPQIEYLFTLLIENAVDEEEMNLFYFFFAEVFRYQQMTIQSYISEDNFNFILFEILLKIELWSLPYSAFNLFKQIFFYINSTHKNMTLIAQKIVDIKDFTQLIGFETLWKFYIESKNINVSNDSQALLVSIIATLAKRDDSRESFLFIFEKIFSNLGMYYNSLKEKQNLISNNSNNLQLYQEIDIEERTNKLINLLFIVNSTRQKMEKPNVENWTLNIQNFYFSGEGKKTLLTLPSDTTVKDLKSNIICKVLYPNSSNDDRNLYSVESSLMLLSKGRILKNDKLTLKDLKLESNALIMVHKGEVGQMDVEVSEERLKELVLNLKTVFESLEDEVIKRALKKNNFNADETVVFLFEEDNIANIRAEIQDEFSNAVVIQDVTNIELFDEEKLKLLVDFLDLELITVNKNIWQLLSAIKFPVSLINMLIEPGQINFQHILDISRPNRMLIYLRIVNCLVFNDKYFVNMSKIEESRVSEWKMNLLLSDGLVTLIDAMKSIVESLNNLKPGSNYCLMNSLIMNLQILSKWMHFFTFSTAISLSSSKDSLLMTIKQIVHMRPQEVHIGVTNTQAHVPPVPSIPSVPSCVSNISAPVSATTPNNSTPTFGSLHSSFSATNEDRSKKVSHAIKTFGNIAEDYDANYEEEVANSFYIKLISLNFHINILNFIHFASNPHTIVYYSHQNEQIYLQLLEVLIILNDINPECFKETIAIEFTNSTIINLLFVEKSKFVRKVVENLFIIMTSQYKNFDVSSLSSVKNLILQINSRNNNSTCNITTIKELLMIHIINNYKRIYSGQVYEEFFNLFGFMLLNIDNEEKEDKSNVSLESILGFGEDFNVKNLTNHILEILHNLSQKNDFELTEIEQEQLSGNIYLFQCLCVNHNKVIQSCLENENSDKEDNLVRFLYRNLFVIESNANSDNKSFESVRFKYSSKNLRQKTYNLLISLMRLNENYNKDLGKCLLTHHTSFKNDVVSNMDLDIGLRSKNDRFIGLKNYGCTCYLNSLIQQLYMIPSFRNGVYSVPLSAEIERERNPLYQLQLLFANLEYSLKQYHTPLHFIKSFNAFNNEPINVTVQQDCEEFLNILVDRLESVAKEFKMETIFDQSIRSKLSYETISQEKETPYYSENVSSLLAINLDIKNKRSIEEALDLFIKGEILEGENKLFVEEYEKKISVMRRCSIKKLPPNVIINLKRFEFDYNTFEKVKLNDYCEFPNIIDFKPWMRVTILSQNRDDPSFKNVVIEEEELNQLNDPEGFKYKLTGVLVHSGSTADGGHYFSYIYNVETDKWHRFDDSKVSDFNSNDIRAECFGEDRENLDLFSRSQNAYLLFYTKCSVLNEKITGKEISSQIQSNILNQIKEENMVFLKYKNFLDNDYFMFLREFLDYSVLKNKTTDKLTRKEKSLSKRDLINDEIYNRTMSVVKTDNLDFNNSDHFEAIKRIYLEAQEEVIKDFKSKSNDKVNPSPSPSPVRNLKKKIIKLGVFFYFEIIIQQRDKHKTNSFANFIIELLETDRESAAWLLKTLTNNRNLFVEYILGNNFTEVREGFSRIITNCIHSLYNDESKYLNEVYNYLMLCEVDSKEFFKCEEEYRSSLMRFFKNNILDLFDFTRSYWTKNHQFMQIILECFSCGHHSLVSLSFKKELFSRVIYYIMNNQTRFNTNFPTMGNKGMEPNFSILVEVLSVMVISAVTDGVFNLHQFSVHSLYQNIDSLIKLPLNWQMLIEKEVMGYNILRKHHTEATVKMVHHLAWGDIQTTTTLVNDIITTIKDNLRDINAMTNLIKNAAGILDVDDSLKLQRVRLLFCLDDISEAENDSLFNYLMSYRDESPLSVMICLKLLGDLIRKYPFVVAYVTEYASKLVWIFYFLRDINNDLNRKENLQIEASTENYNFLDLLKSVEEIYLNELKVRSFLNLPPANDFNINNFNKEEYKESDLMLDFNQEIQENKNIAKKGFEDEDSPDPL